MEEQFQDFYARQLGSKKSEIERLRSYIAELENSEAKLKQEFDAQLNEKNRQVKSLASMLRAASKKSYGSKSQLIDLHTREISAKEKEIEKLRIQIAEFSDKYDRKNREVSAILKDRDSQIDSLLTLVKSREKVNHKLSLELDEKINSENEYVERIKDAIKKKERANRVLVEKLTSEINARDAEVAKQREISGSSEKLIRQLNSQVVLQERKISELNSFIAQKELVISKIEQNFMRQLRIKNSEIERLSVQRSPLRPDLDVKKELASVRAKLSVKARQVDSLNADAISLKDQNALLKERLDERQRLYTESEQNYSQVIHSIQQQHQERLNELLQNTADHESELRAEIGKLKALKHQETLSFADKRKDIDSAIEMFNEASSRVLKAKGVDLSAVSQNKAADDYLKSKESELSELLREVDLRVKDLVRKEQELTKREERMLREQDILSSEFSVLKSAGTELSKEREFLKKDREEHSSVIEALVPDAPQPQAVFVSPKRPLALSEEEKKEEALSILRKPAEADAQSSSKKGIFSEAKSRAKILKSPVSKAVKARIERPKLKEELVKAQGDSFPELNGYSEVDEIRSIVEIGRAHGDSDEQIKSSLESSGYSKKNIEAVFSG